jgi:hypothetical protein
LTEDDFIDLDGDEIPKIVHEKGMSLDSNHALM